MNFFSDKKHEEEEENDRSRDHVSVSNHVPNTEIDFNVNVCNSVELCHNSLCSYFSLIYETDIV